MLKSRYSKAGEVIRIHQNHHVKKRLPIKSIIEQLNEVERLSVEDLLQGVKTLEEELDNLPSLEDHLAEVERLAEQMKRDLEEYLNE